MTIRHIVYPSLRVQKLTQDGKGKSIPTDLGTEHFDGGPIRRPLEVTFALVKEGLESRCGQKCKKSRDPVLKFSLLTTLA